VFLFLVIVIVMGFDWFAGWKVFEVFFAGSMWNWALDITLWLISMDFGSLVMSYLSFCGNVLVVNNNISGVMICMFGNSSNMFLHFLNFFGVVNKCGLLGCSMS
tara:strand:- start:1596 stop:1907 length:312 start_codon:yes stop_codon:yes gene_type:complete